MTEKPRAVLVGWDTLEAPTYRHEALEGYQAGRAFDDELVDQLAVLPFFVAACGFANAKAPGYEADDFLAAAVAREERRGGAAVVATGDRDAFQLASERTTILQPIRAGEVARIGPAEVRARYGVDRRRCRTSSRCAGMPPTASRAPSASDPRAQPASCASTARSRRPCGGALRGAGREAQALPLDRDDGPCRAAAAAAGQKPTWRRPRRSPATGSSTSSPSASRAWRRRNRDPTRPCGRSKMLTAQPARPLGTAPR